MKQDIVHKLFPVLLSYQKENWLSFFGMSSSCSTMWKCVSIQWVKCDKSYFRKEKNFLFP